MQVNGGIKDKNYNQIKATSQGVSLLSFGYHFILQAPFGSPPPRRLPLRYWITSQREPTPHKVTKSEIVQEETRNKSNKKVQKQERLCKRNLIM